MRSTIGCGRPMSHGGGEPTYAESHPRAIESPQPATGDARAGPWSRRNECHRDRSLRRSIAASGPGLQPTLAAHAIAIGRGPRRRPDLVHTARGSRAVCRPPATGRTQARGLRDGPRGRPVRGGDRRSHRPRLRRHRRGGARDDCRPARAVRGPARRCRAPQARPGRRGRIGSTRTGCSSSAARTPSRTGSRMERPPRRPGGEG